MHSNLCSYKLDPRNVFSNDSLLQLQAQFTPLFESSSISNASLFSNYTLFNSTSNPLFTLQTLQDISALNQALLFNPLTASNFTFNPSATGDTARQQADIAAYSLLVRVVTDSYSLLFGSDSSSLAAW